MTEERQIVILMPVYQDWASAAAVCELLDKELGAQPELKTRVILVDDGSPDNLDGWRTLNPRSIERIDVLRLRTNLGHQRALCVGLCYIGEHIPCDWILVMDADGEDRPEDAVRLINMAMRTPVTVVFAERRKRLEGPIFRLGYNAFRAVHWLLTGVSVRVGNFSVITRAMLNRLVYMPELWNHYAGAIYKSKVKFECIGMNRGRRLYGKSRMNFVSLVTHGLAGVATFYETVATRILIGNVIGLVVLAVILAIIVGIRLWTGLAIPGWATFSGGLVIIAFVQVAAISFNLVFSIMSNRTRVTFIPIRDYAIYVAGFSRE